MMYPRLCSLRVAIGIATLILILAAGAAWAHLPIDGDLMILKQPDGTKVEIRAWGSDHYVRIEDLDGYTLVRDDRTQVICYAQLSADGQSFESTGVAAGDPVPAGIVRGLVLPREVRAAITRAGRQRFAAEEQALFSDKDRNPQPSNQGDVLGLTLIIDFSDEPGTIPATEFDGYLNQSGYNGYGNNGSVRDYFLDVSGDVLNYSNYVPAEYIRAPQPKSYYEDPNIDHGIRARQLVVWALNYMDDNGHDFSVYDANGDGYIDAVNVFYAGYPSGGWAVGLWPHSWVMTFNADGLSSYRYQITNIGASLRLSTFCHENGHMIMFWPDLYDYGHESSGIGGFCLMCSSGSGTNPVRPCGYLRAEAGWETPVMLQGLQPDLIASHDDMTIYKLPKPGVENEFYMVENRQRRGRDSSIPGSGLAIWHIDTEGSNDHEQQLPGQHYLVTLVQADGRWDLENGNNNGDQTDLWYAPNYTEFDPTTNPAATWWDGTDAPLYIDGISTSDPVMTFNFREGLGTMGVTVQPEPASLLAPWTLTGPNGYEETGEGYDAMLVWDEGLYTLTWGDVPGWSEPDPIEQTVEMVEGGAPAVFIGTYTDPPFQTVAVGAAGDAGPAAAVAWIDIDGDGDEDLHLINDGSADRLLRNDGDFVFTDITPPLLADMGAGRAAAWGDYDNDGDADVYLVRYNEPNVLFAQVDGDFVDVTSQSYGIDDSGAGTDAMWTDYDGDGLIDLYVVCDGSPNLVFRNYGDLGGGYPMLLSDTHPAIQNAGPGTTAAWRDHDRDGDRDVYLVNDGEANLLANNFGGVGFENSGQSTVADDGPGRDAAWGDFDNDGDWDLYLVNSGAADALYENSAGYFMQMFDPVVSDEGAGQSVSAADLDNDGFLDLYIARNGQDDLLIFGAPDGEFRRTSLGLEDTSGPGVLAACADLDGDGGIDVYVGRDGEPNLVLHNTIQNRGHWLGVDLVGHELNVSAIGALVRLVVGDLNQMREVDAGDGRGQVPHAVHFGLGAASLADSLIVTWPNGDVTTLTNVNGDRIITVLQNQDATPVTEVAPATTRLYAAYPNPFNPTTTVAFDLARSGPVRLEVFGVDGRLISTLLQEDRVAGHHMVTWQGTDHKGRAAASGVYLCRLQTTDGTSSVRLMLIK